MKTLQLKLNKAIMLLGLLLTGIFVNSQNTLALNTFSDWLFVKSDKAVQIRYLAKKMNGDIGEFQVQFRIAFEDDIHCRNHNCQGYLMTFGVPTLDGQNIIYYHYRMMNTFVDTYTFPEIIKLKMSFSDGSKRFLTDKGFFYTTADDSNPQPNSYIFSNCVDNLISNYPYNNCKDFDESKAITLQ